MPSKGELSSPPPPYYSPLPPSPPPQNPNFYHQELQQPDQYYVLLPIYRSRRRCLSSRLRSLLLSSLTAFLLLSLVVFILWPSDPDLQVVGLRLNNLRVRTEPSVSLDISIALTVKVRNRDFFSLDYDSLNVAIGYRGTQLGFVSSTSGHLRARGSSYIEATLRLDGVELIHDFFYLIEDLAKGVIPFDAVSEVRGDVGLLIFKVPIKAKVSCDVYVNIDNQSIVRQDCYPKVSCASYVMNPENMQRIDFVITSQ